MNPNNPEDTTRESSDQESCANTRGLEAPQMKKGGFRDIGCITWSLVAVALLVGILLPSVEKVREAANRAKSQDQLMQIAFAMLNSASNNKDETLPAVAIYDRDGNPLLSWRVAILPFIEQQQLYDQFHLDEVWDSPHNLPLLAKMPKTYQMPGNPNDSNTYYRVFHGEGAPFDGTKGVKLKDFPDGILSTILVIEADESVPWTKPEEFEYDANSPLPKLGSHWKGKFYVALADGSVRSVELKGNE